jgi:hypothetical protein
MGIKDDGLMEGMIQYKIWRGRGGVVVLFTGN